MAVRLLPPAVASEPAVTIRALNTVHATIVVTHTAAVILRLVFVASVLIVRRLEVVNVNVFRVKKQTVCFVFVVHIISHSFLHVALPRALQLAKVILTKLVDRFKVETNAGDRR